ncbi:hypothetical protein K1W54_04575 [Micromonospora sp. CPCC 205371]|nr:hypothetical protein [Micromonospora sp. CPCC 205371]
MTTEVFVVRGATATQVEVRDLNIQATFSTRGGRSADFTADTAYLDDGLFDPLQDHVLIRTGVRGVGDVPLFLGRVGSVADENTGEVAITLMSRGDELLRVPFETPFPANASNPCSSEMARIIKSIDPAWAVSMAVAADAPVPSGTVWEDDPGQALDDLAAAINAIWLPDRTGGFSIFTNPYSLTTTPTAVLTVTDGEDGVLVNVRHVRSREPVSNSITVVVERTDGFAPIRVTARDTVATSPTRWGGPFGRAAQVLKIQTPLSRADATVVAQRRLMQSLALTRTWSLTMPPGLGQILDPGDVVYVWYRDEVTAQVVESIRYAGHAESTVVADTREFRTFTPTPE